MAGFRHWIVGALLVCALGVSAQPVNRYMVFFKDKEGSSFSVSEPLEFLSEKAIARRIKENVDITDQDFPVNSAYVSGVSGTGADVFFSTRWMNGVLIQCDPALVASIQALAFVDHVEFVAPQARLQKNGRSKVTLRKKNGATAVRTQTQLQMLGIPQMHADGFRGEGIDIALFDGGFPGVNLTQPFQHIFNEGRFNAEASHDFIRNSDNVFQYDDHGSQVFSVIAAEVADEFTGGAYEANFQLYVTEDDGPEHRIEEYNWLFAAERADSAGVDIISSSLGYYDFDDASMNYSTSQMDGQTAVSSRAAQMASDRGIVVVASAGNEGNIPSWRIITAPADAEGVIAVANVNTSGVASSSSSIGPSSDGRIKPDLAALGTGVNVVQSNGNMSTASGTSVAAPLITSLVAGVWQAYPELTSKEIVLLLKSTASRATNPNNSVGYGIPNYESIKNYLAENTQTELFEVFPNPAKDTLIISPIDPDSVSFCHVEVVNSVGQKVASEDVSFSWLTKNHKSDISALAPGLYFVRISFEQQKFVFKLVKE
jgi:serine protease AprX